MPATSSKPKVRIKKSSPPPTPAIELRGANRLAFASTEQEVMLAGGAQTGKTMACILKCHAICGTIPNVQGGIVRKAYNSLVGTVVRSFIRIIQPEKRGIQVFGGETPSRFIYPNGSVIWLGGLDNPARVLSSERDFIYVNQAEELTLNDWELLLTRCTGRAAVVQNPQLFGDCNPAGSKHWIRERHHEKRLLLLNATHKDNPSLYTEDGILTEDGARQMAALENSLTGVRRKRLLEGIWATSEGAVYDNFDASVHVRVRMRQEMKHFWLAMDEGYTTPAVILEIGADSDGRHHCFREFYKRGVLQSEIVSLAKKWLLETHAEYAAVDGAAAGLIADLNNVGVWAKAGKGRVLDGIQWVQNRLKVQGDGKPRYTVDPGCVEHINEFESYTWKPEKDVPIKEHDHSMDAYRYLLDVQGEPGGGIGSVADIATGSKDKTGSELVSDLPLVMDRSFFG